MRVIYLFIFSMIAINALYSQFAPSAGEEGSTAIHKDSSVFVAWAVNVEIHRGYIDISNKSLGYVDYGEDNYALSKADGKVVSLGDSGIAVIHLINPVLNGDSWDFAVFENGFNDEFLELAFVEVSSDGEHYFRFPCISLTDTVEQIETFGTLDARKLHNFAGKYRVNYGTPFDLDSLPDDEFLDKNNILFIKIIDVVGSMDRRYASYDFYGHKVNDPYPTPFNTGGFDLDAAGIIHQKEYNKTNERELISATIYPNPALDIIVIDIKNIVDSYYNGCFKILNATGDEIYSFNGEHSNEFKINISGFNKGLYYVVFGNNDMKRKVIGKFIKF